MKRLAMILAVWFVLAAAVLAQMETPKVGPEHKRLDIFAGTWLLEGTMKATSMGPAGTITENEKCEWMDGNFYLICHTDFKSPTMGNGTGLSLMGYSSEDKTYTYREFNSWGEFNDSKGSVDGDTWTWTSDEKMGGMTMHGRFTMKNVTPTSYSFNYDMSQDGKTWNTVMEGKATKSK